MSTFFMRHDYLNRWLMVMFFLFTVVGLTVQVVVDHHDFNTRTTVLFVYVVCLIMATVIVWRAVRRSRYYAEFTDTQWAPREVTNEVETSASCVLVTNAAFFVDWIFARFEKEATFVAYEDAAPPVPTWPGMSSPVWRSLVVKQVQEHPRGCSVQTLLFQSQKRIRPDRLSWSCLVSTEVSVPTKSNHVFKPPY